MGGDGGARTTTEPQRGSIEVNATTTPSSVDTPGDLADVPTPSGQRGRSATTAIRRHLDTIVDEPRARLLARVLALLVAFGALLAVLHSLRSGAFAADDIWISQTSQQLAAHHQSIWDHIVEATRGWMRSQGRFFPGTIGLGTLTLDIFRDRADYKTWQIVLVLLDVGLVAAWVRSVTRDWWASILAIFLAGTVLQFRVFYDAIQHFAGQQGYSVALFFGTLLAVNAFVRSGHWRWLALTIPLWIACLTTYETTYLCLPVLWISTLAVPATWRRRAIAATAALVPVLLLGFYVLGLRSNLVGPTKPGYQSNFDPSAVVPTLGRQLVGSLPLSQSWAAHKRGLAGPFGGLPRTVLGVVGLILVIAVVAIAIWRMRIALRSAGVLAACGAILMVVPALVVSITVRWQHELGPGEAYVSAYLQSFGFVLLVLAALGCASIALRSWSEQREVAVGVSAALTLVVAIVIASGIATVATNNERVIASNIGDRGWLDQQPVLGWPRDTLVDATRTGLLTGIPRNAGIVAVPGGPWVNDEYVGYYAEHPVDIVNPWKVGTLSPGAAGRIPGCPEGPGPCDASANYQRALWVDAQGYDRGVAAVGKTAGVNMTGNHPMNVALTLTGVRAYVAAPGVDELARPEICVAGASGRPRIVRAADRVAHGSGWVLVDFPDTLRLDPTTIRAAHDHACR